MRGRVRSKDSALWNLSSGSDLGVRVDRRILADDDSAETEVTVAFDTKASNQGLVYATTVFECKQVVLAKNRSAVDPDVLADLCTKEAAIEVDASAVDGKDTSARSSQELVDYPPSQIVSAVPVQELDK